MARALKTTGMVKVGSIQDLLFNVEKVEYTDCATNSNCTHSIFAYPNDEKLKLTDCSNIYELVPNRDIFPNIEQVLLLNNIKYTATYSHINHAQFVVTYQITDKRFEITVNGDFDVIRPQITVYHSYDRSIKYRIIVGYFRVVCSNGLVIAIDLMSEYNLIISGKHTKEILNSIKKLNDVIERFANTAEIMQQITDRYKKMALMSFNLNTLDSVIEKTLKLAGIKTTENSNFSGLKNIRDRIIAELNNEQLKYKKPNNWLVYNGINAYINDNKLNVASPEARMEKDQKVFEILLKNKLAA